MASTLIESASRFHQQLAGLADTWLDAVRHAPTDARHPNDLLRRLVLPLETAPETLVTPESVVAELAGRLMVSPEDEMRREVHRRLLTIAADLACASDRVLERLADIAWETASRRALLLPRDVLDVSKCGVLAAISLANLSFAFHQLRRYPKTPLEPQTLEAIVLPVQMAVEGTVTPRPGDLWLLDLIARTVRLAPRSDRQAVAGRGIAAARGAIPPAWDQLLERVVPLYVSASLVHKLVEADQLTPQVAKKSKYRIWPGLESVIGDPGAASLRSLIIGEVARRVVDDKVGLARGAMIRFLQALLALDDPADRFQVRLFIAQLFWEMLEQDDAALQPLFSDQRYMDIFRRALHAVEEDARDGSAEVRVDGERLKETRLCLQTYEQYKALVHILKPPLALTGGSRHEERAKHE